MLSKTPVSSRITLSIAFDIFLNTMIWICSDNTIKEPLVLLFYKLQKNFTSVTESSHKLLDSFNLFLKLTFFIENKSMNTYQATSNSLIICNIGFKFSEQFSTIFNCFKNFPHQITYGNYFTLLCLIGVILSMTTIIKEVIVEFSNVIKALIDKK